MPFFSVIVPEHNSEKFMRKGLDSIKEQTFTDYELIIVCDACTDNTVNIAKEYTDKVFEIDKKRCGAARNLGLDNAKGQWILFMDDDSRLREKDYQTTMKNTIMKNINQSTEPIKIHELTEKLEIVNTNLSKLNAAIK